MLALCGCAVHRPTPAPRTTIPGEQCSLERITGSLVATRVCTLPQQRTEIRRSTQDAQEFLNHQVMPACPGSPGCK
jgi:hypothetical protein